MDNDRSASQAVNRRIALLIDADNVSHTKIALMLAELSKYGTANIRRAYGDWGSASLKGWKAKLHDFAIRPIQQFSYSAGKNATDIALVIDAMELLYTQDLDAFCIASSDADFTPLIMQLKANGHDVYGFGARKTPDPFVNACTTFLYLESLEDPGTATAESVPAEPSRPAPATRGRQRQPAAAKPAARKLADDEALVTILRGAVDAAAWDD
ncbi:MAG TPA: NYN domain-containing protein, partial [Croceibacterium sp.]